MTVLTSVLQEKVSSRSFDGKRLRRHVLRGAVIVFVTAGYSGKRFIFEKVRCPNDVARYLSNDCEFNLKGLVFASRMQRRASDKMVVHIFMMRVR